MWTLFRNDWKSEEETKGVAMIIKYLEKNEWKIVRDEQGHGTSEESSTSSTCHSAEFAIVRSTPLLILCFLLCELSSKFLLMNGIYRMEKCI